MNVFIAYNSTFNDEAYATRGLGDGEILGAYDTYLGVPSTLVATVLAI